MRIAFGLLALIVLFAGCAKKPEVAPGATVSFNYTLKVDGQVVDTNEGKAPMTYVQGGTDIIPGLQEQMVGLHIGEKKTITVGPDKAYGPVNPDAMRNIPKGAFSDAATLKVGDMVRGNAGNGQQFSARVAEVTADSIRLDMNHPLAGKTLSFDVTIMQITPAGKTPAPEAPKAGEKG